jgi:hypothetical protein
MRSIVSERRAWRPRLGNDEAAPPATFVRQHIHEALEAAGIHDRFRPAHDFRVASATSGVLAGEHPTKLMERCGWENYSTAKGYIELAGVVHHEEADKLAALRLGQKTA